MNDLYLETRVITCPWCWQPFEISIDLSVSEQSYTEDCFVCCRPIVISCRVESGAVTELEAAAENA